jgi:hypothetical protein
MYSKPLKNGEPFGFSKRRPQRNKSKTEKLLEIPENKELVCVLKFGVSDEEPKPKKSRPDFSWLHRNKYSQP